MAGGELYGENRIISGVSTDTRKLHFGDLFIALQGEKFDGHEYINESIEQIVQGVMVHKPVSTNLPVIKVEDTLDGMTRWAHSWRLKVNPSLVAVTGSNGKTTVKQMIRSILARVGNVCATQGNLNNQIGVPLTLLTLREHDQYAVIELGANHSGEIHQLSMLAEPMIAIITNAGPAHLEGFGSIEAVARAKGEIIDGVREGGTLILNADDKYCDYWMQRSNGLEVLTFGFEADAQVRAIAYNENRLTIKTPEDELEVMLPVVGKHNMYNALAATAAALALQVDVNDIALGLRNADQAGGRLQIKQGILGATIIDDTYNANPASLQAAIDVLCSQEKEPWLVLGDMGELGEDAERIHAQMGEVARSAGVKKLFGLGELAAHTVTAFGEGGAHFLRHEDLVKELLSQLESGHCVLVKGSRVMHMEDVVKFLEKSEVVH